MISKMGVLIAVALPLCFALPTAASAEDSGHYSCSGVATAPDGTRVGLSVIVEDYRAQNGADRDYFLSTTYGRIPYSGQATKVRDAGSAVEGYIELKNGKHILYFGSFSIDYASQPVVKLAMSGKFNDSLASGVLLHIDTKLPCVDFSP